MIKCLLTERDRTGRYLAFCQDTRSPTQSVSASYLHILLLENDPIDNAIKEVEVELTRALFLRSRWPLSLFCFKWYLLGLK